MNHVETAVNLFKSNLTKMSTSLAACEEEKNRKSTAQKIRARTKPVIAPKATTGFSTQTIDSLQPIKRKNKNAARKIIGKTNIKKN